MSDLHYDPACKDKMDKLLLVIPGVKASKAFGHPAYKVNSKLFAFVGIDGVAIKLPARRAQMLIGLYKFMKLFEPTDGIVWKEWVSIERAEPEDYEQDVPLFEESVAYVASK